MIAIWAEPYRRARVFSFLDPWSDAQGSGFQIVQAMIGIGSGGITGAGLGEGVQKVLYLPEAHTDMIFAVVGEELGLVGSALVIGAFATFAFAGFRIAMRCRDPFGKLLAAGLTALVCAQDDQPRGGARHRAAPRITHLSYGVEPRRPPRGGGDSP
jgi:cell division protein FtsW